MLAVEKCKRVHKRKIGSIDIYFLSVEAIVVAEERQSVHGDMSNYILLQSWHERNKAPFRRFTRHLKSKNNLTFVDIQTLAGRYNIQVTSVSSQIIPSQFKGERMTVFDLLNSREGVHA